MPGSFDVNNYAVITALVM